MSVAGLNGVSASYTNYESKVAKAETKTNETKTNTAADTGAVYDKSSSDTSKKPYKVAKMSASQRASIVKQLKQDQMDRQSKLLDIVNNTINKQAKTFAQANDDFWKFLAKGDFTVDAETKAQAQKDIAEDGYYGVKQTAQRLFDFASALAGDDKEQMEKMQAAIEKGFKQAEKTWGGELPQISQDTMDAVNKMFDDYYSSKNANTAE